MELSKKKEANCLTTSFKLREVGDAYTYLAFKRNTQFFICFTVGKWNEETCNAFYELLASRMRYPSSKRRITIISDGNKQNISAIKHHFLQGSVNHAMRKKLRHGQHVIGIISKVLCGSLAKTKISINQIDGFCSKLRERISCFVRKARTFAKQKQGLVNRLEIFSIQHNFIEATNTKTPAMKEGLINKILTWSTFFNIRLPILT